MSAVKQFGNSKGVLLPSPIIKKLGLKVGDNLTIKERNGAILIQRAQKKPRYELDELLAKCDESVPLPEELKEWDRLAPVGNEEW
ncbi:MAG: hypothetical protein JKY60_20075 [Kordiimonadaceae bacterium]|nr:hypothetical protein [Kordiimonadaceae bacterium]